MDELIKEEKKEIKIITPNEIERKLLNVKYEYVNGVIIRLNKIREDVDYFIKLNTILRDMDSEKFLKKIREYNDESNLDLLENLIKLKEANFRILEQLNRQIVEASK